MSTSWSRAVGRLGIILVLGGFLGGCLDASGDGGPGDGTSAVGDFDGPGADTSDPRGPDISASDLPELDRTVMAIGPEGGTIETGDLALRIPAGALSEPVEIAVVTRDSAALSRVIAASPLFELLPEGLQFDTPAELELNYTDDGGEAPLQLLRGDTLNAALAPVAGASVADGSGSAQIDGFSVYLIGRLPDTDYAPQFEVDGVGYSSAPVDHGDVEGFGYTYARATDGASHLGLSGALWFADDHCFLFGVGGDGLADPLGGNNATGSSFPYVGNETPLSGRKGASQLPLPEGDRTTPLEDGFARGEVLRPFRWGVRLEDDGSVYLDVLDRLEFYVEFTDADDASLSTDADWTPGEGPGFGSGVLRGMTPDAPSDQHFCLFAEIGAIVTGSDGRICREQANVNLFGEVGTLRRCFAAGMLDGRYELVDDGGDTLIGGEFKQGVADGGWSGTAGSGRRMSGSFDSGERTGSWSFSDAEGRVTEEVSFSGHSDSPFGPRELANGLYRTYHSGTSGRVREEGVYVDGLKSGAWSIYDDDGMTLLTVEEYDAQRPRVQGETCLGEICESTVRDRLIKRSNYDWGGCFSDLNLLSEIEYDDAGQSTNVTCFELQGSPSEPRKGPTADCPSVCSA